MIRFQDCIFFANRRASEMLRIPLNPDGCFISSRLIHRQSLETNLNRQTGGGHILRKTSAASHS